MAASTPLEIVPATASDIAALVDAHQRFMRNYYSARLGGYYLRHFFWPILLDEPGTNVFIARESDAVAGFVICTRETDRLRSRLLAGAGIVGNALLLWRSLTDPLVMRSSLGNILNLLKPRDTLLPSAELFLIGVDECCRGKGIGRRLMEAMDVWFRKVGEDTCFLRVRADNASAIRLYETMAFERSREVTEMGERWLLMAKRYDSTKSVSP